MRKIIIAIGLSLAATAAYAACTTSTITMNGKTVICTTCCTAAGCNTVCM